MAIIEEFSHLMELDESGITIFADAEAMAEQIREWFDTPEGTVADLPGWGHNLIQFKHEPLDVNMEVMMEMKITVKLPRDIPGIILKGIRVEAVEIDKCHVFINFGYGEFTGEVSL